MKMTILVGLPASGKTKWAMQNRSKNDVVVCRDDLRMMNYGVWFGDPIDENFITKQEKQMIISAFENGQSVISANTNLNKSNVQGLVNLASQFQAEVEFIYLELPPSTLIEYDKNRDKSVGAKVINRMASKAGINDKGWIPKYDCYYHKIKPYVNDSLKPEAIVVDIDGTVAHKSDRSPYDYSRVYEDSVNANVSSIIHWLHDYRETDNPDAPEIIFLSGRSNDCRSETVKWLEDKFWTNYQEYSLYMRPSDDPNTADFIVKDRLFDERIADKYNVIGVFDDRRQVVTMWRSKGLTVFDVAGNKF